MKDMREMTCREFDEAVHGFVRMELLDVNVREALLEHASHCELCAERMADASALAEATETAGRLAGEAETPAQVETALLAAYRNHHRRASWRRSVEWASVGAAAAVLLLFLWTAAWHSRGQSSTPAPKKDVTSESSAPLDANAHPATKPEEAPAVETAPAEVAASLETPANESYAASDFVPVPFTGTISADDPGMIVRVQLTRASLAQLGYPVAETPDEDLILADVLVGEDGWPRGVKLIQ
jgi:hypothetical protein